MIYVALGLAFLAGCIVTFVFVWDRLQEQPVMKRCSKCNGFYDVGNVCPVCASVIERDK